MAGAAMATVPAWPGGRSVSSPWPGPAPQTEGKAAPWRETGPGDPGLEGRREVPRDTRGRETNREGERGF